MTMQPPRLSVSGIRKSFPGICALDGVNFDVRPGEVHGLLGENGAGKSTLLNVLSAVLRADEGEIRIDGNLVTPSKPADSRAAGIAMIHQELQHIPALSVAQNMFLGRPVKRMCGLFVDRRRQEACAKEILRDLDPTIDPAQPIHELRVAQQQIVEIARALMDDARIIAMDEPTSSLTPTEFEALVVLIERLTACGVSVIYVSHKMDEVFRVCQRATILRDGRWITTIDLAETTEAQVVANMVGRDITYEAHEGHASDELALQVRDLGNGDLVHDANFVLHRGEVLGISGLVGSGRTELLRLIAGVDGTESGSIEIGGKSHSFRSPRQAIACGIGLVPEERKKDGIVHARSIESNIALPCMKRFTHIGLIRRAELRREANELMTRLRLRPHDVSRPIGKFSGGNQQKAIIGRWFAADAQILLFDEPTRGIDIGTKSEIYDLIETLAASGKAIIVVSSEMAEILRVSDRVLVMREGTIAATLSGSDLTEATIASHVIPQSQSLPAIGGAQQTGASA